jgi:phage I-like protein
MFLAPRLPSPLAGLKSPPERLLIAKWGLNESVNGNFRVGEKTAKFLPALQKLLGFDTVKLDFEHNTVPGTAAYKADKEPRNIAADARLAVVPGEGIYAEGLKWTPHGVKSVTEGLHSDLSPTIKTDDDGEVVFIHSAGLCRQGAVTDLRVFSAGEILTPEQLRTFSATINPNPASSMDYKKLLIILLGLDANAADADIETAATSFAETAKTHTTTLKTLGEKITALEQAAAKAGENKTHAPEIEQLNTKLAALEKSTAGSERSQLVAEAIRAGKIVPHGAAIDQLSNEQFKAVLDSLPVDQVPLAQRTPEGLKTFSAARPESDSASAVRKALNLSKEAWDKHSQAANAA